MQVKPITPGELIELQQRASYEKPIQRATRVKSAPKASSTQARVKISVRDDAGQSAENRAAQNTAPKDRFRQAKLRLQQVRSIAPVMSNHYMAE